MGEGRRGRWLLLQASRPCQRGQEVCRAFSWGTCSVHRHATARGRRGRVRERCSGVITSVGEDVGNRSRLHTAAGMVLLSHSIRTAGFTRFLAGMTPARQRDRHVLPTLIHQGRTSSLVLGQDLLRGPWLLQVYPSSMAKLGIHGCECKLPLTVKTGTRYLTSLSSHSRASVKWDDSSTDCK